MPIPPPTPITATASTSRVSRTLYRHLLRWCRATDPKLPLTQWVPPIYLRAPEEVEPYHMEMLSMTTLISNYHHNTDRMISWIHQQLPHGQFHKYHMVIPISNTKELYNFFRVIFRINSYLPVEETYQKQRIDNAFQALKSLNQLSSDTIQPYLLQQQRHLDRTGIQYSIGQVVKHVKHKWRGVIVGWDPISSSSPTTTTPTSLTTKQYPAEQSSSSSSTKVTYHIIVDAGDAHQLNWKPKGITTIHIQDELQLETNPLLQHIRHEMVDEFFEGFHNGSFVPPPLLAYTYPHDDTVVQQPQPCDPNDNNNNNNTKSGLPVPIENVADQIVQGVQGLAQELENIRKQYDSVVGPLEELHFISLAAGHVAPPIQRGMELLLSSFVQQVLHETVHPITLAALHIRDLIAIVDQLQDAFTHRQNVAQHISNIHFRIGDIVQHKVFGYRGVITGWDPRPVIDVSRWDGIQSLIQKGKDPNQIPFYHVVRHLEQDEQIISSGGVPSPGAAMRYVCQENLEICHRVNDLKIDLEDPAWKRKNDQYIPPPLLQFKYKQETDPTMEQCFIQMMHVLNEWQSHAITNTIPSQSVAKDLSISNLMKCLPYCYKLSDASTFQEAIREIRQAHPNLELRWKLANGLNQTLTGDTDKALEIFVSLVEKDSYYIEAWNKRATCEFMLGLYDEATISSQKVLELDPNHLPALNGLGLIHFQRSHYESARECFTRSIELDPWSPVAPKLSRCLDILNQSQEDDTSNL